MFEARSSPRLLSRITCPHCWGAFAPEQVLWISEHSDQLGDPLLGLEQQQRFLPSRFNLEGNALDSKGMACRSLACPYCHLSIPRCSLELEIAFFSILGAAASGKSYLLTAMIHEFRNILPSQFGLTFTDIDPALNRVINECEESLFFNSEPERSTPLGNLIKKTELEGELYETIALGNQTVTYPHPFLFDLRANVGHQRYEEDTSWASLLCLYDNAGEHFLPGKDTTATPVTRHLAQSRALLFVFDPMQDQRFSAALRARGPAIGVTGKGRFSRQELIIHEAAARIRRYTGLAQGERHPRPLIVSLTKVDQWGCLLPDDSGAEPWRTLKGVNQAMLDVECIEQQSSNLRQLLLQLSPEIVTAAEGFCTDVTYIATSALGDRVAVDPQSGILGIRPQDIRPRWVAIPLLFAINRTLPGFIGRFRRRASNGQVQ
jgi:hypothetical protein